MTYPSKFQKVMFWSMEVAIVIIPHWIVVGAPLMGGPGGWNRSVLIYRVAPAVFVYHTLLFLVVAYKNRYITRRCNYHVSRLMAICLVVYYICHVLIQLFYENQTKSSVLNQWFGIDQVVPSQSVCNVFIYVTIVSGVSLLWSVLLWDEPFEIEYPVQRDGENTEQALFLENSVVNV